MSTELSNFMNTPAPSFWDPNNHMDIQMEKAIIKAYEKGLKDSKDEIESNIIDVDILEEDKR